MNLKIRLLFMTTLLAAFFSFTSNAFAIVEEGLRLMEGVTLGHGFTRVDESEGIKLWDLVTVRPFVQVQEAYDSNVFLAEKDAVDDWISSLAAGAEAELKLGDVYLQSAYIFDMNIFADHDEENNYNHTLLGKVDWQLTDIEFIVKDIYRRFSDRSGSEITDRLSRQRNTLSADAIVDANRLTFDTGYDFIMDDYLSNEIYDAGLTYSETQDHNEHVFREEVSMQLWPKTAVLGEIDVGKINYDSPAHAGSAYIQPLVGVKGELLPNSVSSIKVGIRNQDWDGEDDDFRGFVAKAQATKNFGQKDALTVTAERSVDESTYSVNNYYVLNHVGLGYIHQFNEKLSAHGAASYQQNRYPEPTLEELRTTKRIDNYYRAAAGLRYDIKKWFTTAVAYQYTQRESVHARYDYIDHRATLSGMIQF